LDSRSSCGPTATNARAADVHSSAADASTANRGATASADARSTTAGEATASSADATTTSAATASGTTTTAASAAVAATITAAALSSERFGDQTNHQGRNCGPRKEFLHRVAPLEY